MLNRIVLCRCLVVFSLVWVMPASAHDVTTPGSTAVTHEHYDTTQAPYFMTPAEKAAIAANIEATYASADVKGIAGYEYNCHSYAWEGGNCWIGDPGVYADSYELDWSDGHKLTYKERLEDSPAHSAIDKEALNYRATSKWGHWNLVEHDWDDVHVIYGDVEGAYSLKEEGCE